MGKTSLNEFSIRSPKRYKLILAVAHGLEKGRTCKEVFKELGISESYGYTTCHQFRENIQEIRDTLSRGDEKKPSAMQITKELLREKSPELAQVLVDLALDKEAPKRERVAAAKSGLQMAGIQEEAAQKFQYVDMRSIIMRIYQGETKALETIGEMVNPKNHDTN